MDESVFALWEIALISVRRFGEYIQYWGKIIDVAVALIMGGGFWGVVLGLLIGHMLDKTRSRKTAWLASQREHQVLFFATAFEAMGHLTKPKGRVTEAGIHIASQLIDRMSLRGASHIAVRDALRVGKSDNYPLRERICQFRSVCFGRLDLIRMFLGIQIQVAFADGPLHPNERAVLYVIAEESGISRTQFDQFLRMMQDGAQFGGGCQQQSGGGNWQQAQCSSTLEDAYNVLGMKPTDDATTIKRACRKPMGEHHPDKSVAKGLPPEVMEMAKQKTQEIQQAYEPIRQQKRSK